MTLFSIAHADQSRGEFDGAMEYFGRAITADPSHLWAHLFLPLVPIYRGDFALAEEKLRSARQVAGNDAMVEAGEALLWARRGERRKAMQSAQRALRHRQVVTYTHHACHAVAATFAQLGKLTEAVSALRKATRIGLPDYPLFRDDPLLAPLHKERGFLQLMTELKRTWDGTRREFEKSQT